LYIGHIATLLNIKDNLFIDFSTYKIAYKRKKQAPNLLFIQISKVQEQGDHISALRQAGADKKSYARAWA